MVLVCVQPCIFQSCFLCLGTRPISVAPGRKPREVEWRYAPASMEAAGLEPAARSPSTNPCRLRYARASRARSEIPPHIPDHPISEPYPCPTDHSPPSCSTYTFHGAYTTTTAAATQFSFETSYMPLVKKAHFPSTEKHIFDDASSQSV